MKRVAVDKAKSRLDKAKAAFARCQESTSFEFFRDAWGDFLISGNAVLNILEAGARHFPQGRQWYGELRAAGEKDALVLYMRHARNEEEHGIEPTSREMVGAAKIFAGAGGFTIDPTKVPKGTSFLEALEHPEIYKSGNAEIALVKGPVLVTVTNRAGDRFEPPTAHKGMEIAYPNPFSVGELYLEYLEEIIAEAESHL